MHSPRRFAVFVLVGINAGAASGLCGPVVGAALCGLAGFAATLGATSWK
jgi:hypothetical protein